MSNDGIFGETKAKTQGINFSNYKIVLNKQFAYNPSRLNVGSLALKTNDKVSVVSPLYECFTTSQNNQYLLEWFDSKYFFKLA